MIRALMIAIFTLAYIAWQVVPTPPSQKIEWVIKSTPAHKGHPPSRPNEVRCVDAANDLTPPKYVTVSDYARLAKGDRCPEGK
jgi:hypothetical protein